MKENLSRLRFGSRVEKKLTFFVDVAPASRVTCADVVLALRQYSSRIEYKTNFFRQYGSRIEYKTNLFADMVHALK